MKAQESIGRRRGVTRVGENGLAGGFKASEQVKLGEKADWRR